MKVKVTKIIEAEINEEIFEKWLLDNEFASVEEWEEIFEEKFPTCEEYFSDISSENLSGIEMAQGLGDYKYEIIKSIFSHQKTEINPK